MNLSRLPLYTALAFLAACTTVPTTRLPPPLPPPAPEYWLDLLRGEEVTEAEVVDDLATAQVIYVGETHTLSRHHAMQLRLLQELYARRVPLVLCLEQLEAADQPTVDRYARREIDLATFVRETKWAEKWRNYEDYVPLCEFARQHGIPIRALNAPSGLIRAVSRGGGVAGLTPEQRAQLPADLSIEDPLYERLVTQQLAVHVAADPAKLRPMYEAQMARDETMAANVVAARREGSGPARTAFVVLGAGHMRFGLGTPGGVRRREPGIVERLVIATESGELRLSEADKAASREVTITHADLRAMGRAPADYLRVLPRSSLPELPPGHPPIP